MRRVALTIFVMSSFAMAQKAPSSSFTAGTADDEAQIRAIVKSASQDQPNPHVAGDLDWENAFGIRYNDLKTRDAFYHEVVTPLQKDDTSATLEVKLRFLTPDVAVADEYWHIAGQLDVETRKPGPDRWGRTTYLFTKKSGVWTEVLERVADLRLPYYKHYDTLPAAVPVPPATLASYAGTYLILSNKHEIVIAAEGDHLTWKSPSRTRIMVPVSSTEFLLFDPKDLAEYARVRFAASNGRIEATLLSETGDSPEPLRKLR